MGSTPAVSQAPIPSFKLHVPALDGVRGIAILIVLCHMFSIFSRPDDFLGRGLDTLFGMGWTGVQLFFALSGFLITGILLDTSRHENYFRAFYARRTLRIFPLYYLVLIVAFVILPLAGVHLRSLDADAPHQIWLWVYLENWTGPLHLADHTFPQFWSLAVEEQFYWLWPLFLWKKSPRDAVRLALITVLIAQVARAVMIARGLGSDWLYLTSITRMDALAYGALAAAAVRIPGVREVLAARRGSLLLGALVVVVMGALATHFYSLDTAAGQWLSYPASAIGSALFVLWAALAKASTGSMSERLLAMPPLRAMGKYSYAMYVFHKPLHDLVGKPLLARLGWSTAPTDTVHCLVYMVAGVGVTFGLGYLSYVLLERPFLSLKRYVPYAEESAPDGALGRPA